MPSFDLPTPVVPHMTIRGFEDIVVRAANDLLKMLIWLILRKADERNHNDTWVGKGGSREKRYATENNKERG